MTDIPRDASFHHAPGGDGADPSEGAPDVLTAEVRRLLDLAETGQGAHDVLPVTGVVYGIAERFESFAFLDDRQADTLVAEIGAIQSCTTLGELRELVPTLIYAWSPLDPNEDDYPDLPDDHPIDMDDYDSWPIMAVQYGLDDLSGPVVDDLIEAAGAEVVSTMLDGDYLHVPLDREDDMLAVLHRHGLTVRRDDALIEGLGQ